jgi:hypothetical protein
LVRLKHQVDFDLFGKANAAYVIVGKDNYLYEQAYIDAYYGRDYLGEEKIARELKKIKQVQDTLQKQGKLIFIAFAAGKASFYPEYIPDNQKTERKPTNYQEFIRKSKALNINYIDFNEYFISQKNKSKYPLYPQYGIHWSNYGSVLAFDSITKYVENKLRIKLPRLVMKSVDLPDTLRKPDDDIINGMNLLKQPATFKMAYQNYEVQYDPATQKKPSCVVVADSYWWNIYGLGLQTQVFNKGDFWYYNKEVYPDFFSNPVYVNRCDYYTRLRNADVIIIMHTEATLSKFGNGFTDLCYETFCQKRDTAKERIQFFEEAIVKTPDWFGQVKSKAEARGLPLDSMLLFDARYTYEESLKKK